MILFLKLPWSLSSFKAPTNFLERIKILKPLKSPPEPSKTPCYILKYLCNRPGTPVQLTSDSPNLPRSPPLKAPVELIWEQLKSLKPFWNLLKHSEMTWYALNTLKCLCITPWILHEANLRACKALWKHYESPWISLKRFETPLNLPTAHCFNFLVDPVYRFQYTEWIHKIIADIFVWGNSERFIK